MQLIDFVEVKKRKKGLCRGSLEKTNVAGNVEPDIFALPDYFITVNGSSLHGGNGPCNFHSDPNTYCTGFSNGAIASVSGEIENGKISLKGFMLVSGGAAFEGFTYDIQANTVPEPGTLMLSLGGLFALMIARKSLRPSSANN